MTQISVDSGWAKVFEAILKDKDRLLHPKTTVKSGGKEVKTDLDEMIFFLGDMKCILTDKGWTFEVPPEGDQSKLH